MIRGTRTAEIDPEDLRGAIRDVLDREATSERVRVVMDEPAGHDAALYALMAELGWTGLAIPEAYGGAGATSVELGIVLQELGRSLVPSAFTASVVLFGGALLLAGRKDQCASLLPRIASGDLLASAALGGAAGRCEVESLSITVEDRGTSLSLSGTADYVPSAELAEQVLVAARAPRGDTALVLVDPRHEAVEIEPQPVFDPTRRFSRLALHDLVVPRESMLGDFASGEAVRERLLDLGAIALACDSTGGAGRVLESTVAFMKERKQFDRPIASFQALKHRCVDMMMRVEASGVSVGMALEAFSREEEDGPVAASEAKFYSCDSYVEVAKEGLQMHGGVGFTWEYDCHLYLKRALLNQALLGDSRWHRDRAADLLLGPARARIPFHSSAPQS
jgi:alkylation response protein AidB-like acyl-CoA dehydrogenase